MKYPQNIVFKGYKCFHDSILFPDISSVNIIIGRNNIGKSSILDIFELLSKKSLPPGLEVQFDIELGESQLRKVFLENNSGGEINGNHWRQAGKYLIGETITLKVLEDMQMQFLSCETSDYRRFFNTENARRLINTFNNPFCEVKIRKVLAERDIQKEKASMDNLDLQGNGTGATNLIHNIINKVDLDSSLIQTELVNAFNEIMIPDMEITNIVTQIDSDTDWEIYLDDKYNGRVALSKCGSGLKTVLLVLLNLIIIPKIEQSYNKRFYYLEELENNLHPALQRRLYHYVYSMSQKNSFTLFITTHSNVVIDLFSYYENVNMYSLIKQEEKLHFNWVKTIFQKRNILDELDIRASDLLQTNSLIWVEGPSDRHYINKFISFYANVKIKEGLHYQYVYYGGRLLSHYSAQEEDIEDLLSIMRINKNSIIVIDSDKKNQQARINSTKKRVVEEFKVAQLPFWVTRGREIENYIPAIALSKYLGLCEEIPLDQYQDIKDYLNNIVSGKGNLFEHNKVAFAEKIVSFFDKVDIDMHYDIKEKTEDIITFIKKCNKI